MQELAVDKDGKVLVWTGAAPVPSSESRVPSSTQPLIPNPQSQSATRRRYLAERIRAEQAALEARGATDGERKTITALFADLQRFHGADRATGAAEISTLWLAQLAEAYGKGGQVEEGLATVAEALAFVDKTKERFYEAELYRLKGELLLQKAGKVETLR